MQFEDFDSKIKKAADHHHPSYNETAWKKMEDLLDKHLPQKRDNRRRYIFFILFPLLMTGGVWLLLSKPWRDKETLAQQEQSKTSTISTAPAANATAGKTIPVSDNNQQTTTAVIPPASGTADPVDNTKESPQLAGADKFATTPNGDAKEQMETTIASPSARKKKVTAGQPSAPGAANNATSIRDKAQTTEESIVSLPKSTDIKPADTKPEEKKTITAADPITDNNKPATATVTNDAVVTDKKDAIPAVSNTRKNNKESKKNNSFSLSLSAGPDISSVGADRPGRTKLLAGVGVGYTIKDRFTIRTGFYSARKIYSASKEDYKPAAVPPNYLYLDNIAADCKVYEIPLSLTYHFGRSPRHNFFASAGLSSYLMKKEVYDYQYKYPGNPPVTYSHTYSFKNENNHFFSVLGISAGYQRNLSKVVSIMAEPYVKVPLGGVGNGNVKLNSAGLLFSVTIKPFQHRDQKNNLIKPVGQ